MIGKHWFLALAVISATASTSLVAQTVSSGLRGSTHAAWATYLVRGQGVLDVNAIVTKPEASASDLLALSATLAATTAAARELLR